MIRSEVGVYIHTVQYYVALRKNIMQFSSTWMELEEIMLSEVFKRKVRDAEWFLWSFSYVEVKDINKIATKKAKIIKLWTDPHSWLVGTVTGRERCWGASGSEVNTFVLGIVLQLYIWDLLLIVLKMRIFKSIKINIKIKWFTVLY